MAYYGDTGFGIPDQAQLAQQRNELATKQQQLRNSYDIEREYETRLNGLRIQNINNVFELKLEKLNDFDKLELAKENKLTAQKLSNSQSYFQQLANYENRAAAQKLDIEKTVNETLINMGMGRLEAQYQAEMQIIDSEFAERMALADEFEKKQLEAERDRRKKARAEKLKEENEEFKRLEKVRDYQTKKEKERREKEVKEKRKQAGEDITKNDLTVGFFGPGVSLGDRAKNLKNAFTNESGDFDMRKGMAEMINAVSDLAKQLDNRIDSIAALTSKIDTRLQGSDKTWGNNMFGFGGISSLYSQAAGISPLVRQAELAQSLEQAVNTGITWNVEQRALLNVVKDKIATTFNAFDSSLLRLIRIQQADTTAGRLGMESTLNTFLNQMYSTSEYLTGVANSVRMSLVEAESLMDDAGASMAFEYQVQKWLGSLQSVGMADQTVTGIASALGQIAAGDLSGLTGSGTGNLMIMAANRSGQSIAEILAKGLDDSKANALLEAMVDYLAEMYEAANDSKVVQQQIAKVFGVTASDMKAALNLMSSSSTVSAQYLSYDQGLAQLYDMAGSMYSRTSMGEMLTNVWDNLQYTLASNIANNPVLYGIYKVAGLLDTLVGGISIPALSYFGTGFDLETTVADLMRVASLSGSVLSSMAQLLVGFSNGGNGGITGGGILNAVGLSNSGYSMLSRGTYGGNKKASGSSVSSSGAIVGNSDANAVQDKVIGDASSESEQTVQAKEEEDENTKNIKKLKTIDENILAMKALFSSIIAENDGMYVKIRDYGLVGLQ